MFAEVGSQGFNRQYVCIGTVDDSRLFDDKLLSAQMIIFLLSLESGQPMTKLQNFDNLLHVFGKKGLRRQSSKLYVMHTKLKNRRTRSLHSFINANVGTVPLSWKAPYDQ